jgi:hypothetical protein
LNIIYFGFGSWWAVVESLVIEVPGEVVERLDDFVVMMGFRS